MLEICISLLRSLVVVLLVAVSALAGTTYNCADCEEATVSAMLASESVVTGDIVTIPADTCNWSGTVTIPDGKKITVQGSGKASTLITGGTLDMGMSGSKLTGIGFSETVIKTEGNGFVIDDISMTFASWTSGIIAQTINNHTPDIITGVICRSNLTNMRILVAGTNYNMSESNAQHLLWSNSEDLGGTNKVFIEGNYFYSGTGALCCVDASYGGSYAYRYNTSDGLYIETHSANYLHRAAKEWEIYNNYIGNSGEAKSLPFLITGGTGVIFNNRLGGNWNAQSVILTNVRSYADGGGESGQCNGGSDWDGNDVGVGNGWPCRDQIGRGPDNPQWEDSPVGEYTQPSYPTYVWNNLQADGETPMVVYISNDCDAWIVEDRDYYLSEKPGYTPYTCPHPLTGLPGSCDPNVAGVAGYNVGIHTMTLGGAGTQTFTLGGAGTQTFTVSP